MEHDGEYKSARLAGNKHLLMTTWTTVLSDVSQFRGLCEEQEADGFLPIRPGEFEPEAPRRILG